MLITVCEIDGPTLSHDVLLERFCCILSCFSDFRKYEIYDSIVTGTYIYTHTGCSNEAAGGVWTVHAG